MSLSFIRERSNFVFIVFAGIIVSFVFTFNTGSGGCFGRSPQNPLLAKVDGREVDIGDLNVAREMLRGQNPLIGQFAHFPSLSGQSNLLAMLQGAQYPADSTAFADDTSLRYAGFTRSQTLEDQQSENARAMNEYIESLLVSGEAAKLGLAISDRDVNDRVLDAQFFDKDGKFQEEMFRNYMRNLGISQDEYRELVRREMLREKVIDLIATLTTLPEGEVDGLFVAINEEVRFDYIAVDPAKSADLVPVTEAEITEASKDAAGLKKYYDENKYEFEKEARAKVRALLIAAPAPSAIAEAGDKKADLEKQRADAQTKVGELRTQITAAETGAADAFAAKRDKFAELAKANSAEEELKPNGGLLDELALPVLIEVKFEKAVADAAVALQKGQVSEVVAGDKGFWLVFADDVLAAESKTLEQATPQIGKKLAQAKKAAAWSKETAGVLLAAAKASPEKDLQAIADDWNERNRPGASAPPGGPEQAPPPEAAPPVEAKPAEAAPPAEAKPPEAAPPAEGAPVAAPPVEGAPVAAPPVEGAPVAAPPVEGAPVAAPPVEGAPVAAPPVEGAPVAAPPVEGAPVVEPVPAAPIIEVPPAPVEPPVPPTFPGMLVVNTSPAIGRLEQNRYPGAAFQYPRKKDGVFEDADDTTPHSAEDDSWTAVPGIGKNEKLLKELGTMTPAAPLASEVYTAEDGKRFLVIRFKERKAPSGDDIEAQKTELRRKLLAVRQRDAYRAWYQSVYDKALKGGDLRLEKDWGDLLSQEWKSIQATFKRRQPTSAAPSASVVSTPVVVPAAPVVSPAAPVVSPAAPGVAPPAAP